MATLFAKWTSERDQARIDDGVVWIVTSLFFEKLFMALQQQTRQDTESLNEQLVDLGISAQFK